MHLYESNNLTFASASVARYQPHHHWHLQYGHRLGLDRHHHRRHVDSIGYDNRVNVALISQQRGLIDRRKLNICYTAYSKSGAG